MNSLFICPICSAPLQRQEKNYCCPNRHSFDISKEGYTHLLPANRKHSALPGDDKGMAAARRDFLSQGYYQPLLDALTAEICARTGNAPVLLDAGCGEGYYTDGICRGLCKAGKTVQAAGIDISKFILRHAAKRTTNGEFAVASSYHLPVSDGCVDVLLNCFSPLALEEFHRVLKVGGYFFYVVPAADHLWSMKEVLYDDPYPNEEKETPYDGFSYEAIVPVEETVTLRCQQDIHNLFQMTPYYWKTPREGAQRLSALETLATRIAFRIHIFRKLP